MLLKTAEDVALGCASAVEIVSSAVEIFFPQLGMIAHSFYLFWKMFESVVSSLALPLPSLPSPPLPCLGLTLVYPFPGDQSKKAKLAASTLEQSQSLGMGGSLSNGRTVLTVKPNGDLELADGNNVVRRCNNRVGGRGAQRGTLFLNFPLFAVDRASQQ